MARDNPISRRTAMKLTGAAAATALVAGCSDDDGNGNGDENGDENGAEAVEISPDETIVLEGITGGWEGVEPSDIEGEENPTLALEEGEEYEMEWQQGDGSQHNIEIWDEDEEMVDDYGTDLTDDPDEALTFEVTDEMAYYRCQPHPNMQGEIELQ